MKVMSKYGGLAMNNGQKWLKIIYKENNRATKKQLSGKMSRFKTTFYNTTQFMTTIIFSTLHHPMKRHGSCSAGQIESLPILLLPVKLTPSLNIGTSSGIKMTCLDMRYSIDT